MGAATEIWQLDNILGPREIEGGRHDRLFVPREAHVTGDLNIHEITVESSGRVVFAATTRDVAANGLSDLAVYEQLRLPAESATAVQL